MKRYEAYKDSGIDWIGEIPEGWEVVRFKRLFKEKKKITDASLNSGSISFGEVVYKDDEKITEATKLSYQVLNEGEFLLNPLNMNYDLKSLRIGLSTINVVVSSGYIILQSKKGLNKNYYRWLLRMYDIVFMKTLGAGVRQTINYNDLADSHLVVPSFDEQQAIAEFLDNKTAKIDQTIAIKQKEIELLKERRQILIQQAVTGKIVWDASTNAWTEPVEVKDSGVDWIGEIPEHWEVKKLKYCLAIKNGQDYKHVETDSGYPVIGSGGQFAYASKYLYDGEAILLGRKGTIDKPQHINGKFWTVDTMFYSIPKKKFLGKFLFYCCQCIPFSFYSTATALPSMTQKDLNNHPISIPAFVEQTQIVSYLEDIEAKIAKAITLKEQEIDKLKEYKTVLIDNVVTGKVKIN